MASQTISVDLPDTMAREIREVARREQRSVGEVIGEAWRAYRVDRLARLAALTANYANTRNPMDYTEADIPKLIREVRNDQPAEQE